MTAGLIKKDHVGIVVPDADQAAAFFKNLFDAVIVGVATDIKFDDDDWMREHLNVHPRAVLEKLVMVELFDQSRVELIQYQSPDQNTALPKNSDFGAMHLAFEVEDIEQSIEKLKQMNLTVHGDYSYNDPSWDNVSGVFKGLKWVYFETPWGMTIELVQPEE